MRRRRRRRRKSGFFVNFMMTAIVLGGLAFLVVPIVTEAAEEKKLQADYLAAADLVSAVGDAMFVGDIALPLQGSLVIDGESVERGKLNSSYSAAWPESQVEQEAFNIELTHEGAIMVYTGESYSRGRAFFPRPVLQK